MQGFFLNVWEIQIEGQEALKVDARGKRFPYALILELPLSCEVYLRGNHEVQFFVQIVGDVLCRNFHDWLLKYFNNISRESVKATSQSNWSEVHALGGQ